MPVVDLLLRSYFDVSMEFRSSDETDRLIHYIEENAGNIHGNGCGNVNWLPLKGTLI